MLEGIFQLVLETRLENEVACRPCDTEQHRRSPQLPPLVQKPEEFVRLLVRLAFRHAREFGSTAIGDC